MRSLHVGDVIHDTSGAPVATVTRDILPGDILRPTDFLFADGHRAVNGEPIPAAVTDFLYGLAR